MFQDLDTRMQLCVSALGNKSLVIFKK